MRHQRSRRRLNEKPAHARMLTRNLVTSLLLYERVRTTKKRALVVQPIVDRIVAFAKTHQPSQTIRYVNAIVTDRNASRKVMEVFLERYKSRPSGLTRMRPAGSRIGDGAEVVDLELVDYAVVSTKGKGAKSKEQESMGKENSTKKK